jgi:hypothetical protein
MAAGDFRLRVVTFAAAMAWLFGADHPRDRGGDKLFWRRVDRGFFRPVGLPLGLARRHAVVEEMPCTSGRHAPPCCSAHRRT